MCAVLEKVGMPTSKDNLLVFNQERLLDDEDL
jgi:hypothetical protein